MKSKLTPLAKNLRKSSTDAEKLLWRYLRSKQLAGLKFRRQQPIGDYIVDFVCFENRVIIEADGGLHNKQKDNKRDQWFHEKGFNVLRFWNTDILTNINGVLEIIEKNCLSETPSPNPSLQGRGIKICEKSD